MDVTTILGNGLREAFGPSAAYFALLAIGLNVHFGYTGLANFGQIGFALVGSYGVGMTVTLLGGSIWLGALLGILGGVVLAFALGVPTLRLRGDYFAIVTIAAAEILRLTIRSDLFVTFNERGAPRGGPYGYPDLGAEFRALNPFDSSIQLGLDTWTYTPTQLWSGSVTWGLVAVIAFLVFLLMRSPWGRVIKAIREDEDAARSLGKNVYAYKMQSLVIGGVIGSIGGVMLALQQGSVTDLSFQPINTFFAYTILLLGGMATTWGPIVGSMIFWFLFTGLTSFLAEADKIDILPGFLTGTGGRGALTLSTVGLALVVLMVYRPHGLLGSREELLLDA